MTPLTQRQTSSSDATKANRNMTRALEIIEQGVRPSNQVVYEEINYYRVQLVKEQNVPFKMDRKISTSTMVIEASLEVVKQKGFSDREQMIVFLLDCKNKIIGSSITATGSTSKCAVYPKEIIKLALLGNATSIVLAHNHPSGELDPSPQDIALTKKINQICKDLGINLFDHVIFSFFGDSTHYFSMAKSGYIDLYDDDLKKGVR